MQLEIELKEPRKRGGARPGAGRPRKGEHRSPHVRRPDVSRHHPIHVSLRVVRDVGRLRRPEAFAAIRRAVAVCIGRTDFRIVHTSIQSNHIHLIVEADDKYALENGLRAFMISATRHLNALRGRRGAVFPARYHAVQLTTPLQVRNCLAYVLNNWRRHREDLASSATLRAHVDPYSSGIVFDGWAGLTAPFVVPPGYQPPLVCGPRSWLLRVGWRHHHPLISLRETPGPDRHLPIP
ncbi:MAG TPA: hypothetical protein VM261_37570 [Kofleriaceae bacterium]|nr:hypothetical protein [Kofleriaceae bacterium]